MRARTQLPQVTLADGTRTWLATRYGDVRGFFADSRLSRSVASARGVVGAARALSVTELDPPMHTRIRKLAAGAFSTEGVERLRPRIEQIARALLDGLTAAGPPADLAERFCAPLTFTAQCELLGVPEAYRPILRTWYPVALSSRPGSTPEAVQIGESQLYACTTQILAHKRRQPGSGLFDQLIAARDRHDLLEERELHGVAASFLLDGAFLAATQITNSVRYLLKHPDQMRLLQAHPTLISRAAEELLRLRSAVNHSLSRVATADVELGGTIIIRAGEAVTAALPVANRDAAVFACPGELNLARPVNRHLTFGHGIHYCIGAHLARVELQVGLATLLQRLPSLRLAVPGTELQPFVTQGARGVRALPVSW